MNNIGSITKIEIVSQSDIDTISEPDSNGEISVTLNEGKSWNDFNFTSYSAGFEEDEKQTDPGNMLKQIVSCKVPKVSSEKTLELADYDNRPLVLRITDGNGPKYLFGDKQKPVKMLKKIIRPEHPSGYNGYKITFSSKNTKPAPVIQSD
ncbi:MAG: hypothetical protein H8D45_09600 [Bacteroidetes bacterium]|nr:hypothetical protein [Bacteroidota bacterium]